MTTLARQETAPAMHDSQIHTQASHAEAHGLVPVQDPFDLLDMAHIQPDDAVEVQEKPIVPEPTEVDRITATLEASDLVRESLEEELANAYLERATTVDKLHQIRLRLPRLAAKKQQIEAVLPTIEVETENEKIQQMQLFERVAELDEEIEPHARDKTKLEAQRQQCQDDYDRLISKSSYTTDEATLLNAVTEELYDLDTGGKSLRVRIEDAAEKIAPLAAEMSRLFGKELPTLERSINALEREKVSIEASAADLQAQIDALEFESANLQHDLSRISEFFTHAQKMLRGIRATKALPQVAVLEQATPSYQERV